jgi:hypothetical protein
MNNEQQENNLMKTKYWNPYFARINKNFYELDQIIIYNEDGVLVKTNSGWFNESNNNTGDKYIGEIKKINKNNIEKHLKEKNNFIIKNTNTNFENRYILYIYYKNINYKFIDLKLAYFLEVRYTLFNDDSKIYSKAIGTKNKISQSINYNKIYKCIDSMKYNDVVELKEKIKELNKIIKEYEKAKIFEDSLTIDSKELNKIYFDDEDVQNIINNNKKLMEA